MIITIIFLLKALISPLIKLIVTKNIEVVSISGIIKWGEPDSKFGQVIEHLHDLLRQAKPPKAVIVQINSPGGTVASSQEFFQVIKEFREANIKVVALMEDVAASGGLYVSLAADYIVANAGTITGSIGVIMQSLEYGKILDWFEVKTRTIKSGQYKDILSPTREMTGDEVRLLQELVNDAYGQFFNTVMSERRLPKEVVERFADGRVLTGSQAHALGLVDEIGGFDVAVSAAMKLAGIEDGKEHIGYPKTKTFFGKLTGRLETRLDAILPSSGLAGVPLWLMRRF